MARYPSRSYGRQRNRVRRQIYLISTLLVIAVVIAFIGYYPFDKDKDKTSVPPADANEAKETSPPVVVLPEPNLAGIPPGPTAEDNAEVAELIAKAVALIDAKPAGIIEARTILNDILPMPMSLQQRVFVREKLSELADRWLFSRTIFPQDSLCGSYKVKPGDRLETIGKQHIVPWEILQQINKIQRPETLPMGETIKVINGPFHARVYLSAFTMDLYLQNTFVRGFPVGVGKAGNETPTGLWRVRLNGKQIEPPWPDPVSRKLLHPGDEGYALGSRWIGLEGISGEAKDRTGFGIHGTKEPETIGTASSRGCIRLHNGDVILVYDLLVPIHSRVEVVE